jgi:hypothetical protein
MIEAVRTSETSVHSNETTRRYILEDLKLQNDTLATDYTYETGKTFLQSLSSASLCRPREVSEAVEKEERKTGCCRRGKKSFHPGLKLRVSGVKTMMRVDC